MSSRRNQPQRTARDESELTRRRVLLAAGTGAAAALAGCSSGDDKVHYERGAVENVSGETRSADEMVAAEAVAQLTPNDNARSLDGLSITDYELTVKDGYAGPTVTGTVANDGGRVKLAEVRVRVYDEAGNHLGRYLDSTGDLNGDSTWKFGVVLLESPSDIAAYDIAVLGIPT